tara:strand:- start:22122 stop:23279 length:1158 start_codon:yes stop_codon:yes gene_type:complete
VKIALLAASILQDDPRPRRMLGWMQEISDDISYIGLESDISSMNYKKNINSYVLNGNKRSFLDKVFLALCLFFGLFYLVEKRFANFTVTHEGTEACLENEFDLLVCSDLKMLPYAFEILSPKGRIFFDAREYYPRQYEDRLIWSITIRRFYIYLCRKYLKKIDTVFTVGKGLQKAYKESFNLSCLYLPGYAEKSDITKNLRNENPIRLIYHGNTNPSRGTDILIEIMDFLPQKYQLDLMLMTDYSDKWSQKIREMVESRPNVSIRKPVPSNKLIEVGNEYDIGLVICRPSNFNLRNGMPNKFFEYIQSKLCIVCGIQKEMGKYIEEHKMGLNVNSNDPRKIAQEIQKLDFDKINYYKTNVEEASKFINSDAMKDLFINSLTETLQ